MQFLVNALRGVAIGLANIIPGVSGGTMALILGIYERMITAIGNLGPRTVTAVFRGRAAIGEELRRVDALFLLALGVGALGVIVAVARLMTYLLAQQHDPTYGFFFGLVLVSVVVPYRMIRRKGAVAVLCCLVAAAGIVGLDLAMSGQQRLAGAQQKAAIKAATAAQADGAASARASRYSVPADAKSVLTFFAAGAIAISAMILPGISGSFMLLLMGLYFDVLSFITERNLLMLAVFAAGCGIGLLLFTRLLKVLLERAHDATMAFLLGLVLGSLYPIWPFKRFAMVAGQRVDLGNMLPAGFGANEALTLCAALAGCAVVSVFIWIELRQERAKSPATT